MLLFYPDKNLFPIDVILFSTSQYPATQKKMQHMPFSQRSVTTTTY